MPNTTVWLVVDTPCAARRTGAECLNDLPRDDLRFLRAQSSRPAGCSQRVEQRTGEPHVPAPTIIREFEEDLVDPLRIPNIFGNCEVV